MQEFELRVRTMCAQAEQDLAKATEEYKRATKVYGLAAWFFAGGTAWFIGVLVVVYWFGPWGC